MKTRLCVVFLSSNDKHFNCKRPKKNTHSTFTRPSAQDPDVLNFMMAGDINIEDILSSSKATIEAFYNISGRRDIVIEDVIWSSKYR